MSTRSGGRELFFDNLVLVDWFLIRALQQRKTAPFPAHALLQRMSELFSENPEAKRGIHVAPMHFTSTSTSILSVP